MRKTLSRGMVVAAAATSVLSLCDFAAVADSVAGGTTSGSPGVLSGNTVQAPVHVPVNVCGNTVDVLALLNPAFGNSCANGASRPEPVTPDVPEPTVPGDTGTQQPPPPTGVVTPPPAVSTPPAVNPPAPPATPAEPVRPGSSVPEPASESSTGDSSTGRESEPVRASRESRPELAETGSATTLAASGLSALLIAGGVILYRRGRSTSFR
ncbi:chaplin [Streptomyces shenzhenensis]|nr:chaplin [Streptomyces shenzhenensis]